MVKGISSHWRAQEDGHGFPQVILISFLSVFLTTTVLSARGNAQITTAIIPDSSLPTNTTVTQTGNVHHIAEGTIRGSNQFHSFGQFSVGTGDIASFNGPAGIANILSRVTGGSVSEIDGTLRSTIDGANLFFLNPAGVVFGPNASLDLSGSFHVSTADYIRLGEGSGAGRFSAANPANDVLITAPRQHLDSWEKAHRFSQTSHPPVSQPQLVSRLKDWTLREPLYSSLGVMQV